jgi:MoaA/NifB/PqqE/SkfB family radical SAM enzyme
MTGGYPIELREVNIQTHTLCTRRCVHCGHGQSRRIDAAHMKQAVFEKCLYDLAKIEYRNALSLYCNNEPFLDKRLVDMLRQTSKALPGAKLFLFSNGDLLDLLVLRDCFDAGLQLLEISVYEESSVAKLQQYQKHFGDSKIKLLMQFQTSNGCFHNYGGGVLVGSVNQKVTDRGCMLPFSKMIVTASGAVGLCCVDFFNDFKFGNVMDNSLVDIFMNNADLNAIRGILSSGRIGLEVCGKCSYNGSDYDVFAVPSIGYRRRLLNLIGRILTFEPFNYSHDVET